MLDCKLVIERTLYIKAPSGKAALSLGDEVFIKTTSLGWLRGEIVDLGKDYLGLVGPGIPGLKKVWFRDIEDVRDTAPRGEKWNQFTN